MATVHRVAPLLLVLAFLASSCTHEAALEPEDAGADFSVQGEYRGGDPPLGVQVVARGGGEFDAVVLSGGLPGAGWDGASREVVHGRRDGDRVRFDGPHELEAAAGNLRGKGPGGAPFELARVERRSPTLGAAAPAGAVVLFDGKGPGGFDGEVDERGLLAAGATTKERFQSFDLHLEFRTPFMPTASGQGRGNSGLYLQNRYEVQVLDSFGEIGADNECGGIYEVAAPAVHMALPPLSWQTYDIQFLAAAFDAAGARTAPARVTVRHNGVVIHDAVELPGPTGLGDAESPEPGALYLQDHWNPVFYRNIWLLPRPGG
ncbi:MAG: hypothetical protein CL910_15815 [Deltaproteobacteria bacterium]|jgi:hypothetical protein|nr:hypothetical protein [Deltaproteobacteria bacterium]